MQPRFPTVNSRSSNSMMPDKQLTIATYAAGASLAAITLVYVFAPTFFIDGDAGGSTASSRKRGVVGLMNSANDCFINSVLQALAGLGDLRIYLIRETHRRKLDGPSIYIEAAEDPARRHLPAWKLEGLQRGIVTQGLKNILDALNERPLYKKTISAMPFVGALEDAFRQRISRQQQDAQEFLQVVAERLCDEYHAGHRARHRARQMQIAVSSSIEDGNTEPVEDDSLGRQLTRLAVESGERSSTLEESSTLTADNGEDSPVSEQSQASDANEEEGFPLEGISESQIECLTCGFKPKPSKSTFCTLTLNVPQVSSTSLNACFDGMFKTEYIEDFKCEKCRLVHAVEIFQHELSRSNSDNFKASTRRAIESLTAAIDSNPEEPPKDVELPDSKFAPKRKIARHVRITKFPKIMAIHLSRSIFDVGKSSLKNSAKVQFPERLPLGGLLDQKKYKLLGVVTHKGSHHSGHYESFRRQNIYAPFSNTNVFDGTGVYSKSGTPTLSVIGTPQLSALERPGESSIPSTPELLSPGSPAVSSRVSLASSISSPQPHLSSESFQLQPNSRPKSQPNTSHGPTFTPRDNEANSIRSVARSARSTLSKNRKLNSSSASSSKNDANKASPLAAPPISAGLPKPQRKKIGSDRWWRISDEKIKESKTSDVLGMQKEVYLLFYELERGEAGDS